MMRRGGTRFGVGVGSSNGGLGSLGVVGAAVLALSCGQALAIDTPPNPEMFFPNFGKKFQQGKALDAAPDLSRGAKKLLNRFPGVRALAWKGHVIGFTGTSMTRGETPEAAAAALWMEHGQAFGGRPELAETWSGSVRDGRFRVFHYAQQMDGLPVEFGRATVLVRQAPGNPDLHNRVSMVQGRLAERPMGGFAPDVVSAESATFIAQQLEMSKDLTTWGKPEKVVYFGEGDLEDWITPVRAWKIEGQIVGQPRRYSFFVDCATGEIVFVRGEVQFADVTGTVQANVTPGSGSDNPANPATLRPLQDIFVTAPGASAITSATGAYTLSVAGAGPVNASTTVGSGLWAEVFAPQEPTTPILSETQSALVPGAASFILNPTPSEFTTAQANGFYYQTLTHNHVKQRIPQWDALDFPLAVNVNLTEASGITSCNAFYNGISTNFFINTNGCNNTCGGSVMSHEYGHHVVNRRQLPQGSFGEGYGDTLSMMVHDDPIIGRNFRTNGGVIRTPDTANVQFPCGTSGHFCGQVLGGVMWELRKNYVNFYGTPGLEMIRQLHADWTLITNGGAGPEAAHPAMAEEWFHLDDPNDDTDDGTPNYSRIAAAFTAHSIPVVGLVPIDIDIPDGLPRTVRPGVASAIRVRIEQVSAIPVGSTAKIHYRQGSSGGFTEAALTSTGGNEFRAILPTSGCGEVQYYFSVQSTLGATVTLPAGAPTNVFTLEAHARDVVGADSFEVADPAWTTSEVSNGGVVTGQWERGDPLGTNAQPSTGHDSASCWFTGQGPSGGGVGAADVDNGQVILTSPAYDLAGALGGELSFWLWYSNNQGSAANSDVFTTQISADNGATWVNADVVGPNTNGFSGWNKRTVDLGDIAGFALSAQVRVRFIAEDAPEGSVVEAAVDDFELAAFRCFTCLADIDDSTNSGEPDGAVDVNDLLAFLAGFEAGSAGVDLDNDGDPAIALPDGAVDVNDLLFFLVRFEAGC